MRYILDTCYCKHTYTCIHIYTERERERERETDIYSMSLLFKVYCVILLHVSRRQIGEIRSGVANVGIRSL